MSSRTGAAPASSDSTRLPDTQLRKAIAAHEQYKLLKDQNAIKDSLIAGYDRAVADADSLLAGQRTGITLLRQKVGMLEQVAAGKEAYIGLQQQDIDRLSGSLKKARLQKWFAFGLAALMAVTAATR